MNAVERDALASQHHWNGGYFCSCGQELNSPQGFSRHLLEAAEEHVEARLVAVRALADDLHEDVQAIVNRDHHALTRQAILNRVERRLRAALDAR